MGKCPCPNDTHVDSASCHPHGKADRVREHSHNYIEPACLKGDSKVTVRAGDVHKAMGLRDSMPALATALGANKFQPHAGVQLVKREGPHVGANLRLTFEIL